MSGCDKEGCESPGRATVEFPIKAVCCNTGTFEAVMRAVMDSGSRVASYDSVRAGHDVERCSDKVSALNCLQSKQSRAKVAKPRGEQRGRLGDACGTKHDSSGGLLVVFNCSGKC